MNQCDGCRRKLPVRDGIHYEKDGRIYMGCEHDRYKMFDKPKICDKIQVSNNTRQER